MTNVNLGYPIQIRDLREVGIESRIWGLDAIDGSGKTFPVSYTKEQALEIARRITDYYGQFAE